MYFFSTASFFVVVSTSFVQVHSKWEKREKNGEKVKWKIEEKCRFDTSKSRPEPKNKKRKENRKWKIRRWRSQKSDVWQKQNWKKTYYRIIFGKIEVWFCAKCNIFRRVFCSSLELIWASVWVCECASAFDRKMNLCKSNMNLSSARPSFVGRQHAGQRARNDRNQKLKSRFCCCVFSKLDIISFKIGAKSFQFVLDWDRTKWDECTSDTTVAWTKNRTTIADIKNDIKYDISTTAPNQLYSSHWETNRERASAIRLQEFRV